MPDADELTFQVVYEAVNHVSIQYQGGREKDGSYRELMYLRKNLQRQNMEELDYVPKRRSPLIKGIYLSKPMVSKLSR